MATIHFDNGRCLLVDNTIDELLDILREMRNNNKKFLVDKPRKSIMNIDKIVYIQEEEDE